MNFFALSTASKGDNPWAKPAVIAAAVVHPAPCVHEVGIISSVISVKFSPS